MQFKKSLFIFRRDLRIHDNTALIEALKSSGEVHACFILNPQQLEKNEYRSDCAVAFMKSALHEMQKKIPLAIYEGIPLEVIKKLHATYEFEAIFMNRDYTPYARARDTEIKELCNSLGVECTFCADALLNEPEEVHKSDETPYTVFTPFFRKASENEIKKPRNNTSTNYAQGLQGITLDAQPFQEFDWRTVPSPDTYVNQRDIPHKDATTHLSVHLKFGTISVRKAYHYLLKKYEDHPLIRQLYWRDFFTHITYHFPHVYGKEFHKKYQKLKWNTNENHFTKWCEGNTGFPIVDAGMRELNTTGYMHNRVRMITASFLVKDLHIDWRWGEKYFAQKLIDYDPSLNNGNWQWAASTGCDAVPYFRIFNPWRQQIRFDEECRYIKRWIPELEELTPKQIHAWETQQIKDVKYPQPMIVHKEEAELAKMMFKTIS